MNLLDETRTLTTAPQMPDKLRTEAEARAAGDLGILAKQYALFQEDRGDPWTYLEIDTQKYSDGPHLYHSTEMLQDLICLPYANI